MGLDTVGPLHWLEAEEQALKNKLAGPPGGPAALTVVDVKNAQRPVSVQFRNPERDQADVSFPFIAVSFVSHEIELDRFMSYNVDVQTYLPDQAPHDPANAFYAPYPIPLSLFFVLEVHARSARHNLQLLQRLQQPDMLPLRFGFLEVPSDIVGGDGTIRRLDVISWAQSDYEDENKKRVFRQLITIRINSEMMPEAAWELTQATSVVLEVDTTVTQTN